MPTIITVVINIEKFQIQVFSNFKKYYPILLIFSRVWYLSVRWSFLVQTLVLNILRGAKACCKNPKKNCNIIPNPVFDKVFK